MRAVFLRLERGAPAIRSFIIAATCLVSFLLPCSSLAATWYVATNGNDAADGTSWATAKQTIQAAVDLAVNSDTVLVSNGVYQSGGRVVTGFLLTNRVVITNSIAVQSVNGPGVTTIRGARHPVTTNGDAAVRCVYMGAGARLSGFTLANGATRTSGYWVVERSGGGVWCDPTSVISNCTFSGNSAIYGGGIYGGGYFASAYVAIADCTFTGNSADYGGGAYRSGLFNCMLSSNSAGYGGGASSCTLNDCTLSGNSAYYGGGVNGSTIINCNLSGNSATYGGGAYQATASNCTLLGNSAITTNASGGGAAGGELYDCTLSGNSSARYGGGAYGSTLTGCTLSKNSSLDSGGGTYYGTLSNCIVSGNSCRFSGGGTHLATLYNSVLTGNSSSYGAGAGYSTLINCTISGNYATNVAGGSYYSWLKNCIEYFNSAPLSPNYTGSTFTNSCTTPAPGGTGNITANPQFVNAAGSNFHLLVSSPCINGGNNGFVAGNMDVEGNARIINGTVDMGAYEYQVVTVSVAANNGGTVTGGGSFAAGSNIVISAESTNGHWFFTAWNDGDTNETHTVVVPTSNITYTAIFTQYAGALTFYVAASGDDSADGRAWSTAKLTPQSASVLTAAGDTIIVSNGVYAAGLSVNYQSRVALVPGVTMRSVNGSAVTMIDGQNSIRCVYVGSNAFLSGFTITNGAASGQGGGIWCEATAVVSNCVISGCSSIYDGGGSYGGTLYDCVLSGNDTDSSGGGSANGTLYRCALSGNNAEFGTGGGAYASALNNCTVISNTAPYSQGGGVYGGSTLDSLLAYNSADYGGGASQGYLVNCTLILNSGGFNGGGAGASTLLNSIVYANTASGAGKNYDASSLAYCFTTPLPAGAGNYTNDPVFVDMGGGNFRLSAGSPCRDTGNNGYATNSTTDLDGHVRIVNSYVDVGAYEYQGAGQGDYDGDGNGNGDERIAGTDFTNGNDFFGVSIEDAGSLAFGTVTGRVYAVDRSDALVPSPQVWAEFTNNIAGTGGAIQISDTSPGTNRSYRVRVMRAP